MCKNKKKANKNKKTKKYEIIKILVMNTNSYLSWWCILMKIFMKFFTIDDGSAVES